MTVSLTDKDTIMELKFMTDRLAEVILVAGTTAVKEELTALAARVKHVQPGAAAALVDWEGTEAARERAFAVIRNRQREREEAFSRMNDAQTAFMMERGVR